MNSHEITDYESYDPNHLFDSVLDRLDLKDDAALSDALQVPPTLISDIRNMKTPIDSSILIALHDLTGITISGLYNILGERRKKSRFGEDFNEDME